MPRTGSLALLLACLAALALPAAAPAAIRAKTSLQRGSGTVRVVVKLTSTRSLTARTRPRSVRVRVRAGGRTYALSRARGAGAAAVSAGTWRSTAYRGQAAARLAALAGKGVKVLVASRAGTATLSSTVARPGATAPGTVDPPAVPGPAPAQRPAEVGGEEGRRRFHEALVGHRLRWTNRPTGYDAAETWGFCPTTVYQRYISSSLDTSAWQTVNYQYQVTAGFVHPAQVPQAELLGQILLDNGTRYNIAFAYGRQQGAWAKAGSSSDTPFRVLSYTCGQNLGPDDAD